MEDERKKKERTSIIVSVLIKLLKDGWVEAVMEPHKTVTECKFHDNFAVVINRLSVPSVASSILLVNRFFFLLL